MGHCQKSIGLAWVGYPWWCAHSCALLFQVGGARSYADTFRDTLRDSLFVHEPDNKAIPEDEVVFRKSVCTLAHNGLCKAGDADVYRQCLSTLKVLIRHLLRDAPVSDGEAIEVCCFGEGDIVLHTFTLLVAYVRKADPILVVFSEWRECDGELQLVFHEGIVSLMFATELVKLMHKQPDLTRASVTHLVVKSVVGRGGRLRVESRGAAVDVHGGVAGDHVNTVGESC
jgi:hypothetical protein